MEPDRNQPPPPGRRGVGCLAGIIIGLLAGGVAALTCDPTPRGWDFGMARLSCLFRGIGVAVAVGLLAGLVLTAVMRQRG